MTKKHFIELADAIRPVLNGPIMVHETGKPTRTIQGDMIEALADFCAAQNPRFDRARWMAYIAGECGPNGGNIAPLKRLRHHVSGAIERGEAEAIAEQR